MNILFHVYKATTTFS